MKKAILSSLLLFSAIACFAQTKQPYKPAADLVIHLDVKYSDLVIFMNSAASGFLPWLKTTSTPMNAEETSKKRFSAVFSAIDEQRIKQLKIDSMKFAKKDTISKSK